MLILRAEDPAEILAVQAVASEAAKLLEVRDRNLAVKIAQRVGDLFD